VGPQWRNRGNGAYIGVKSIEIGSKR